LQIIEQSGVRPVAGVAGGGDLFPNEQARQFFEVWEELFNLRFATVLKEVQVQAAMTNIVDTNPLGIDLSTTLSLQTRLAPLFEARLRLPAEYQVTSVLVEGADTAWATVPVVAGINEVRIPLSPPLVPGETRNLAIAAHLEPETWPVTATPIRIAIPEVRLPQASMVEALYGITGPADLDLVPIELTGLDPARQSVLDLLNEKLSETGRSVRLGFTYQDTVFSGQLEIGRRPTLTTVQNVQFFRIDRETLFTRLESALSIIGGGVRELQIQVSETAGEALRFSLAPHMRGGVPGRIVEQTASAPVDGIRTWTLKFDTYLSGDYLLAAEARQPREQAESYSPPKFTISGVDVQSGFLAIEAAGDEFVRITAQSGDGEPLVKVDPVDFPQSVYRPSERMVAGFRAVRPDWTVSVAVARFERSPVPTAVGHSAMLVSVLGSAGDFQHRMTVEFTAVGIQNLRITLPQGANLWSTLLDNQPVEARRTGDQVLLPLSGLQPERRHTLEVLYATDIPAATLANRLQSAPPEISAMTGDGEEQPLEILKQEWLLHYPDDSLLVESLGAFRPIGKLFGFTIIDELKNLIRLPTSGTLLESLIPLSLAALVFVLIGAVWRRTAGAGCLKISLGTLAVIGLVWVLLSALLLPLGLGRRPMPLAGHYYDYDEFNAPTASMPAPAAGEAWDSFREGTAPEAEFAMPLSKSMPTSEGPPQEAPLVEKQLEFGDQLEKAKDISSQDEREQLIRQRSMLGREERKAPGRAAAPDDAPSSGADLAASQNGQAAARFNRRSGAVPAAPPGGVAEPFGTNAPLSPPSPELTPSQATLGLQVQQHQRGEQQAREIKAAEPAVVSSTSGFDARAGFGLAASGGLLSMSIGLQVPAESLSQRFEYQGNGTSAAETGLDLRFADRRINRMLVCAAAFGAALMGWWLRRAKASVKACWLFLTIVLPLAVIGLVPGLYESTILGLLIGGLATVAGWLLVRCVECCRWCLSRFSPACWGKPLFVLAMTTVIGQGTAVRADEAVRPVPAAPPYVVVPYQSLNEIDQADKVWVPVDLYRRLWNAAHVEELPVPPHSLPGMVAEASYLARLSEGAEPHVLVQVRWVVVNLTGKPLTVPLPVQGVGLTEVNVNGVPAALTVDNQGRPAFVAHESGVSIADAAFQVPVQVHKSVGVLPLRLTPVGSGVLTFELPPSDEKLVFRVTGTPAAFRRTSVDGKDRIELPIDRGGNLTLNWQPETQQGNADQLVQIQSAVSLEISDPGIHERCGFRVTVRQGGLNDFTFELPEGLSVQRIDGQDIAGWELIEDQPPRRLKVFFRRTIQESTDFTLDLFVNRPVRMDAETPAFPLVAPLGATRETGLLAVSAAEHLKVRMAESAGLQQIDLKQFQPVVAPTAAAQPPQAAYRFSARPILLTAEVARRVAEVRSQIEHAVDIGLRKVIVASRFHLELSGTPQRLLEFRLPAGYLTMDVVCEHAVDWYEIADGETPRLVIELASPVTGSVEVGLEGHLVKSPESGDVTVSLPEFPGAVRSDMRLGIWFDHVYQASLSNGGSWRPIGVSDLGPAILRLQASPPQFGFRNSDTGGPLQFQVRRASPTLTADQATLIAVGDATIDYGFTIRWNIANAAADLFTFTVPEWLGQLDITGAGIRQTLRSPAGEGRTRWTIALVDPVQGQYLITAAATIPLPVDRIVRTPLVELETVSETGVFAPLETQRTFAVMVNLSPGQLIPVDLQQFESVAADQLPLALPQSLLQQAMEFVRIRPDRLPQWKIQRIDTTDGGQAVVLAATLTTALEMDGSWRTRAVYGIRNRGQQFLGIRIPEGSRILSVIVRGVPSRTVISQVGNEPVHLVALPQTSEVDLSFDVSLLLAGRLGRSLPEALSLSSRELRIPAPGVVTRTESAEFGLTVAQTLWTVHLPEDLDAAPVKNPAATNLTWHHDSVWLAEERQRLDRLKADITEMIRIASDKKASYVRRNEAINNLKQLQLQVANPPSSGISVSHDASGELAAGSGLLYEEAAKAIADNESSISESESLQLDGLVQDRGRAVISNFNRDLYLGNAVAPPVESKERAEGKSLNFYSLDDLKRAGKESESDAKGAATRGKLKEQLANQAPVIQERFDVNQLRQQAVPEEGRGGRMGGIAGGRFHVPQSATWHMDQVQSLSDMSLAAGIPVREQVGEAMAVPEWTSTGGLSIEMELPTGGQQLAFSKVGGTPLLTLSVRPRETWIKLLAGSWCLVCLTVGVWVLRHIGGSGTWIGLFGSLSLLAIIVGIAGFLLLPVEIRWGFFLLFCGGGLLQAILSGCAAREAT